MKVCFLAGTLGCGGAERQLIYMLQTLKSVGINTRLLCLTSGEFYEKEIRDLGIQVDWIGAPKNKFVRLAKIIDNLRKNPCEIFQSSHFYTNIYVAATGKILNIRNIGAIRNDLTSEIAANNFFGKWQLYLPEFLIANSETAKKTAIEKGISPTKIEFVRNVVVGKTKETDLKIKDGINILFVGRLTEQKNPELFVRLAHQLVRKLPNRSLNFQIAGDGELLTNLKNLAKKLDLNDDKFAFLGIRSGMAEIYQKTDILVSTSKFEGTPNVILEAMSYGIPVVSTRVGGVAEILNDMSGILVESGNLESIVNAVDELIINRNLRIKLGKNGREYVENHHSINALREKLTGIYRNLLFENEDK